MSPEPSKYQALVAVAEGVLAFDNGATLEERQQQLRVLRADARKALAMKVGGLRNTDLGEARAKGVATNKARAAVIRARVLPIIAELRAGGLTTYAEIAAELNKRGVPAPRGANWYRASVRAVEVAGE